MSELNPYQLYSSMQILQNAVTKVSQSWDDVVSQAINANHVNNVIQVCNEINHQVASSCERINSDIARLQELESSI